MRTNSASGAELVDGAAPHVAHPAAQPADHLEEHVGHRALVGHAPLDALGDELLRAHLAVLEVAVGRAVLHGGERAHAADHLEAAPLHEDPLAGALLGAGEHRAHHHRLGAGGERLDDVARVLDAAVGDDRHVAGPLDRVHHRGELRHAHAGDDARGADRAGAHADLDRVDAARDQGRRAVARGHVAGDELDVGEALAHRGGGVEHALRVAVRGVEHQHVDAGSHERLRARKVVARRADRGGHAQAAVAVLVGRGVLPALVQVLHGHEPAQHARGVHHRQLLDAVAAHDRLGLVERGAGGGRDELVLGHRLGERAVEGALELQVAVGDDAHQPPLVVDHRHARDLEAGHELHGLAQRGLGGEGDRVHDHPALRALHPVDLGRLPVDRHVLVQHADAAGAGHRDGHLALGHRVHRRRHERHVEGDAAREAAGGAHVLRVHLRVAGREEHVVEGERHGLAHAGGAVRARRGGRLCAVRRSRPVRGGGPAGTRNPAARVVGACGVVGARLGGGAAGDRKRGGRHGGR